MSTATLPSVPPAGGSGSGTDSGAVLYVQAPHESTAIVASLSEIGPRVETVHDAGAALRALRGESFILALVHLADERNGLAAIRALRMHSPHLPIAALMDPARPLVAADALRAGASDLLGVPLDAHEVAAVIANAHDRASVGLSADDPPIPGVRETVVANSAAMRGTVDQVRLAAVDPRGVVIVGEPGSGRTLVARMIHARSERAGQPFVVVDCARTSALAELENILFGLVTDRRPAGAERRATERLGAAGAVCRANGGTLFLKHVVEAPSRVQAKLARLLRDREAVLQETRGVVDIDIRPIVSLDAGPDLSGDEQVRRELFERIAQIRIEVPPFRRRREDIPLIATWILQDVCETQGVLPRAFSRAAMVTLSALPWVGNGRELRTLVETLVRATSRPVVQLEDLFEYVRLDGLVARVESGGTLRDARARFEREWISSVLIKHHGRVGEAARALGIQRTNLYRKVRQLKVARNLLTPRRTNL